MKHSTKIIFLSLFIMLTCLSQAQVKLETKTLLFSVNEKGFLTSLFDKTNQKEYLLPGQSAPLLQLRVNGKFILPVKMEGNARPMIQLHFAEMDLTAKIKVENKQDYLTFELIDVTKNGNIDLVLWGPYPTTIRESIGETVGVVHNENFGIGIQALNLKTLGGYPTNEDDMDPSYDIFKSGNIVDMKPEDKMSFRGQTAKLTEKGSVLQAYCRNRNTDRVIPVWEHDKYLVPAYKKDGGIKGTKIALFGTSSSTLLTAIGKIELKENLPHPVIDGEWGKQSAAATSSYLIMNFGEKNIDTAISICKKAGLHYLYHGGPFETWGHFKLQQNEFPANWASLKQFVQKAGKEDIKVGVHTLSNFITTNDPYVTPVPDKRLAKVGYSVIESAIDEKVTQIVIRSPDFFNQMKNNSLRSVVIGNEIIRYRIVSATAPWTLVDCIRGSFGTKATAHHRGDSIAKLMDQGYKVFLADDALQEEMAVTLANLFNETGLRQISFDGLEGCWASGMGQYARQKFVKTWYDHLQPELKGKVINDASNPGHYFWHIFTRMNWGEPWYAGFRESQTQYRLKNQEYFQRNLMPHMLGWFSMNKQTSLEDLEWLLARAAGFDAGFGLSTGTQVIRDHGMGETVLATIKEWETARLSGAFTETQKKGLRDITREFHLEKAGNNSWNLVPVDHAIFKYEKKITQPGEPVATSFEYKNPYKDQPLQFIIKLQSAKPNGNAKWDNATIEINNYAAIQIPGTITEQQLIVCNGKSINLLNSQWQLISDIPLTGPIPVIGNGSNTIRLEGTVEGDQSPVVHMEVRTMGEGEVVGK
ncbi:MAG: hypothetical protein ABIN89_16370 [Chitinophagaceae bacterium]